MEETWDIHCVIPSGETRIFTKKLPSRPSLEEAALLIKNEVLPNKISFGGNRQDAGDIIKGVMEHLGTKIIKIERRQPR